jgi:hypothetical protein
MVFAETLLFFTEPFFFVKNHFSGILPSGKTQNPFYQKVGSANSCFLESTDRRVWGKPNFVLNYEMLYFKSIKKLLM